MKKVMKDLRVYPENMKRNLAQTRGLIMSEAVMLAMTKKGADRQWAHEVIRRCSMKVWTTKSSFEEVLKSDPYVPKYLCDTEIEAALNPQNYLGTAKKQIDNMVKNVQAYVKALGSK